MPKYLISYRKTEEAGQKPEWTSFTTESDATMEAHAVRERVDKRIGVLGEKLWGAGEVAWVGAGPARRRALQARGGLAGGLHHLRARAGVRGPACPSAPTSGRSS